VVNVREKGGRAGKRRKGKKAKERERGLLKEFKEF
jgi:hypothetical protein